MGEPEVAAWGLVKRFRSRVGRRTVEAVRGLDLRIEPGEVVALVGPNGAGKTTTLRMLLGLVRPDAGSVELHGLAAARPEARWRVGYLPEEFRPYGFHTASRALAFFGGLGGLRGEELLGAVERALESVDLGAVAGRRVGTFSRGMRQRLGLAQALLRQPRLLILDEPTSGLDPAGRGLFAGIIQRERERGAAVLLSTHILEDVERLSDRLLVIDRGRLVLKGTVSELTRAGGIWRLEVEKWGREAAARIGRAGFQILAEVGATASLACQESRKQELLSLLLELGIDVRELRPMSKSLEAVYLEHVGGGGHA